MRKLQKIFLTVAIFVMLKNGQEIKFHDGYQWDRLTNGILISYGADTVFIAMEQIKWVTNNSQVHKHLKSLTN